MKKPRIKLALDFRPIEEHRHKAELSREEVAVALGVTSVTVWRWERNRNQPDLEQLIMLARALGVPMHDLFHVKEARAR